MADLSVLAGEAWCARLLCRG